MGDVTRLEVVSRQGCEDDAVCALDVIEKLDDVRSLAAAGKVRSVFISFTEVDGSSGTRWAGQADDVLDRVGLLELLKHDILMSRG